MATQNSRDAVYDGEKLDLPKSSASSALEPPTAMNREKLTTKAQARQPVRMEANDGFMTRFGGGVRSMWQTRTSERLDPRRDKQKYITTTLRELVIYLIFLVIICIITFGMTDRTMYYYTQVLRDLFVSAEMPSGKLLKDINTDSDFWEYVGRGGPLMAGLYWDKWYDNKPIYPDQKGFIFYENKILGLPRIRTLRMRWDSCNVAEHFEKHIAFCYSEYNAGEENKTEFGLQTGTAFVYSENKDINGTSYGGLIASYKGGGFYLDLPPERTDAESEIDILKSNRWTDRATRAVFVDFTLYNANINLFCVAKLVFEFPATGGILTSYTFRTVRLIRYVRTFDYFVLACEFIFCAFILYYIIEEIIEICKHKRRYFHHFWNLLDIVVILISLGCIAFSVYRHFEIEDKLQSLLDNSQQYANFEFLSYAQTRLNDAMAILIFFVWIKLFKYISFNKTMNQLSTTLGRCAKDVAAFAILFFLMFFAFVQAGYLIFGAHLKEYSTIYDSMFTLMRTILGDFKYKAMEDANPILAPMFFVTYIMLVFFVLMNMFLAIVNDTYAEVKQELAEQKNDFELGHYMKYVNIDKL